MLLLLQERHSLSLMFWFLLASFCLLLPGHARDGLVLIGPAHDVRLVAGKDAAAGHALALHQDGLKSQYKRSRSKITTDY